MRFFLAVLLCFAGGVYSTFVFGQNVTGTWTWVAAGCRDSSLSASSHVTKSKRKNPFQIRASELTLNSDNSASMIIEMSDSDQIMNETGTYTIENNRVVINDPKMSEEENPVLIMRIVEENLLLAFSTYEENSGDSPDEDLSRINTDICGSGKTYVYVFSNVD